MLLLLLANTVTNSDMPAAAQPGAPSLTAKPASSSTVCRNAQGKFSIRCLPPGTVVKRTAAPRPATAAHHKHEKRAGPVADKR